MRTQKACMTTSIAKPSPLYDAKTTWMKDIRPQSGENGKRPRLPNQRHHQLQRIREAAARVLGTKVKVARKASSAREAGDPLYTAGDVLGLPKPSPEAIEYGNRLLQKQRMVPVDGSGRGSVDESLPGLHLFGSTGEAVGACTSQKRQRQPSIL